MSTIKITCDSTADLSDELLTKYHIDTISLYINIDGQSLKDGVEIQPDDIYSYAEKTGTLPKTAAISIQEYVNFFSRYSKEYGAVVHINLGSQFSSSHQNAVIASKEFDNVFVIDSENLSTGSGHLVVEAAKLAIENIDVQSLIEEINQLAAKIEASFVIDTLDYLKMGGRCSALQAFSAGLLNIKPNIEVINGKMEVGKKYRGKIDKAIEKYITNRLKDREDIVTDRIFITHSGCSEELIEKAKQLVQQHQAFDEIIVTRASCTISCHCGPNTLGILFKTK